MSKKTIAVATMFVDLCLGRKERNLAMLLSGDEVQILFATVSEAGFNPKAIVPGALKGDYRDQDGRTGETYPINQMCPFKVISQGCEDDYFATGWLDCALRRVVFGAIRRQENRASLIGAIVAEIEKSVPLEPVQLTLDGDLLSEYPPSPRFLGLEYFVEHSRDESMLSSCVGVHKYCNGWMDRQGATATHDAIVCRSCHLRVLFPKQVKTYGELRQALASKNIPV